MNNCKEHIIFKSVIITLVMALLVPSFVKLAHAFEKHEHEICVKPQKTHFHKFDLDCEFYKFKTSPQIAIAISNSDDLNINNSFSPILSQYHFINDYQRLSLTLEDLQLFSNIFTIKIIH